MQDTGPDILTRDLHPLLALLRHEGFSIGVDTALDVERLARSIAEHGRGLSHKVELNTVLGPIVCKSKLEQERFRRIYEKWEQATAPGDRKDTPVDPDIARTALTVDEAGTDRLEQTSSKNRLAFWLLGATAAALGLLVVGYNAIEVSLIGPGPDVIDPGVDSYPDPSGRRIMGLPEEFIRFVLALLVFAIPFAYKWLRDRRVRVLERRFTTRSMHSQPVSLHTARQLFYADAAAEKSIQLLRQHRVVEGQTLDVRRTLATLIRSAGLTDFIFKDRRVLPEHLLLVDRTSEEDHLRGVADLLEHRLHEANAAVVRYEFDRDPRVLRRRNYFTGQMDDVLSLKDIAARYGGQRLILMTDGSGLTDSLSERPKSWVSEFEAWQRRAILTPTPTSAWGRAEERLESSGFVVAYASTDGLRAVSEAFRAEEGSDAALARGDDDIMSSSAYPPLLDAEPSRWLEDGAPGEDECQILLRELRSYLGHNGFLWCCACAAFPKIHPELTLHLGATLIGESGEPIGTENLLLSLSRLPWFRHGYMPDWLRLILLERLSPQKRKTIREELVDVLMTAKAGAHSGLVLNISDRSSQLAADFFERSAPDETSPVREEIFLSFLRGREPSPLSIVAPSTLVQALRHRIDIGQLMLWGGTAMLALGLWWLHPLRNADIGDVVHVFPAAFVLALSYSLYACRTWSAARTISIWIVSSFFIFLFGGLYSEWFGVFDDEIGMIVVSLAGTGVGLGFAYRRRRNLAGVELALYWLGCVFMLVPLGPVIFDLGNIDFGPGFTDDETGLFSATLAGMLSGLILGLRRGPAREDIELAIYWLGGGTLLIFWCGVAYNAWGRGFGDLFDEDVGGFFIGSVAAFLAGAILALRRGLASAGPEIAIYWLGGASLVVIWCGVLFEITSTNMGISGIPDVAEGLLLGSLISFVAGAGLALRRRRVATGPEVALYWLGGAPLFILLCATVFDAYAINLFGYRDNSLSGLLFGAFTSLGAVSILFFARWEKRTGVETAIYVLGSLVILAIAGIIMLFESL